MKLINFRLKSCLCGCFIVLYLLVTCILLLLDGMRPQPVPIKANTLVSTDLSRKMKPTPLSKPIKSSQSKRCKENQNDLPGYHYSHGRSGVKYVIGVPTVLRSKENYLLRTVDDLVGKLTIQQQNNCLIVIYVGETQKKRVQFVVGQLQEKFDQHLKAGLIDVISPSKQYYPDFTKQFITLNDKPAQAKWRTKQNLDYIYLMSYARTRGSFYLQLEDDIGANIGYLDYIDKFTALHRNFGFRIMRNARIFSFCELGFIGKLFDVRELKFFIDYLNIFYNDQPIDWLLQSYVTMRSCRWDGLNSTDCQTNCNKYLVRSGQSQFQHKGLMSSLGNKEQNLRDILYNKDTVRQRMAHLRQPLNLLMSHKELLMKGNLEPGETFFWGYMPQISWMAKYLMDHQYDNRQVLIQFDQDEDSSPQVTRLFVNIMNSLPTLQRNSGEARNCGFIMSTTFWGNQKLDETQDLIYYYVQEDKSGSSWFRRFFWNAAKRPRKLSGKAQLILLLLLNVWSNYYWANFN